MERSTMGALVTDPLGFFSDYLRVTGVVHIGAEKGNSAPLEGKRLGMLNGSSWITLWSTYFARLYLPGVQLLNMGNDAVQFNFMKAHDAQLECPPLANVERFVQYARDLVELGNVDAVLITCSTMNRNRCEGSGCSSAFRSPGRSDRWADDGSRCGLRRRHLGRCHPRPNRCKYACLA